MSNSPTQSGSSRKGDLAAKFTQTKEMVLLILSWSTFAILIPISVAIEVLSPDMEAKAGSQSIPALPSFVTDMLHARHYWHMLPVFALAVALGATRQRKQLRGDQRLDWIFLIMIWTVVAVSKPVLSFYLDLYRMVSTL